MRSSGVKLGAARGGVHTAIHTFGKNLSKTFSAEATTHNSKRHVRNLLPAQLRSLALMRIPSAYQEITACHPFHHQCTNNSPCYAGDFHISFAIEIYKAQRSSISDFLKSDIAFKGIFGLLFLKDAILGLLSYSAAQKVCVKMFSVA